MSFESEIKDVWKERKALLAAQAKRPLKRNLHAIKRNRLREVDLIVNRASEIFGITPTELIIGVRQWTRKAGP